jgi:hypothetical protein
MYSKKPVYFDPQGPVNVGIIYLSIKIHTLQKQNDPQMIQTERHVSHFGSI